MTDKTNPTEVVAEAVREYVGDGDGADKEVLAAYEQQIRAQALEAARGPYRCCPHCADDIIHDVEKDDHAVPCHLCQIDVIQQAKAEALAEGDGYHTHEELYEYRMLYNAHAARGWLAEGVPVVKSWRHSDGELCFGGGWFVVTADLPAGQVSNHYKAEFWGLFDVPEVGLPPEYDGHTPAEAADRLRADLIEQGGRP